MKLLIRIAALTLFVAAAVAGNTLPKTQNLGAIHGNSPAPMCNPLNETCQNIR
jgi:hypothetical protein